MNGESYRIVENDICDYRTDCQKVECEKYSDCNSTSCEKWNFLIIPLAVPIFNPIDVDLLSSLEESEKTFKKYAKNYSITPDYEKLYMFHSTLDYFCCLTEEQYNKITKLLKDYQQPFDLTLNFAEMGCNGFIKGIQNHVNLNLFMTESFEDKAIEWLTHMEDYLIKNLEKGVIKRRRKDMTRLHMTMAEGIPFDIPLEKPIKEMNEKHSPFSRKNIVVENLFLYRGTLHDFKDFEIIHLKKS